MKCTGLNVLQYISLVKANCEDPTPEDQQSQEFLEVNPEVPDGGYPEGTTVSFSCRTAHDFEVAYLIGPESSTCGSNGTWNPEPPVCKLRKLMFEFFTFTTDCSNSKY